MRTTGTVYLPLHEGRAPRWLYSRMVRLAGGIVKLVAEDRGRMGLLERLSDPLWFQALGCALGFDWHSSGLTTVTSAALREALESADVGVLAAGGKGAAVRTPGEIEGAADALGLSDGRGAAVLRASRLAAKVDSAAVQDGYDLYHHMVFLSEDGDWAIVQQGMSAEEGMARRYHWFSGSLKSFVEEPHRGVVGRRAKLPVLNMVAEESRGARGASVDAAGDMEALRAIRRASERTASLESFMGGGAADVEGEGERYVLPMDFEVDWKRLEEIYEVRPRSYEELLLVRGVGPKVVRALALVADLVYGERPSWRDPVRFSFAHGGKDGIPFPVDRDVYDMTISEVGGLVEASVEGGEERRAALARLRGLVPSPP